MTESEHAIALACERYRKRGRADIRKTDARSIVRGGRRIWTGKGDTDFVGDGPGDEPGHAKPWRLEVKETHEVSLPLSSWSEHQRDTMRAAAGRGCEVRLVIVWLPGWEAYSIPWAPLAKFLDLPWRASITKAMARAWGELLPCEPTTKPGRWRCLFLDGKAHPLQQTALAEVDAERLANPLELFADDDWKPKKGVKGLVDPKLAGAHPLRGSPMDLLVIAKAARRRQGR